MQEHAAAVTGKTDGRIKGVRREKVKVCYRNAKKIRYPKKLLDKAKDEEASKPFHQVSKEMNNQTVKTIK